MRRLILVTCCLAVGFSLGLPGARARVSGGVSEFPYGVGANEVSARSAYVWTQTATAQSLRVIWSTDPNFVAGVKTKVVEVASDHDGTVFFQLRRLAPHTFYYYKFVDEETAVQSPVGQFRTAPTENASVDVTFTFSGDQDGTIDPATGDPAFNSFETFAQAASEAPDFYVNLGDTIYSDSQFLPAPAETLDEYRALHKQNLSYATMQTLRGATGFYSQWDDHEVRNDWDAENVDPMLLANGRQAFIEYEGLTGWDPDVGFYRHFRWGAEAEIFVLDERSFRTAEAHRLDVDTDGTPDCDNPVTGEPDLAPTLSQTWRDFFASQIPGSGLDQPVPPQCTADLEAEGRTMLGQAQRDRFLADLERSTARFKLVMNEDPIQLFFALPYDRWEGYRWERNMILSFVDDNDIDNVVWLTTDIHAYLAHTVDYNTDEPGLGQQVQGMVDYTVGPVATFNFRAEINSEVGDDTATKVRLFLLGVNKNFCANLGAAPPTPGAPYYGYGLVTIDAGTHTLTVMPKDYSGTPIAGNGVVGGTGDEDTARDKECYDYVATAP